MITPWLAPVLTVLAMAGLVAIAPTRDRLLTAAWLTGVYVVATILWGFTWALGWWSL